MEDGQGQSKSGIVGLVVILMAVFIFIVGITWAVLGGLQKVSKSTGQNIKLPTNGSGELFSVWSESSPTQGPANATVSVVEFGDFECPYCRDSFTIVRELMSEYEGQVKWQWRHFPLIDIHAQAKRAAEASECALEQGNFWGYHDKLFLNQGDFTDNSLVRYALQLGLDKDKFAECLSSGRFSDKVQRDVNAGLAVGLTGTPTFFINGRKVPGVIPRDIFATMLESALRG